MSIMLQELQGEIKSLIYSDMDHVYIVESLERYQTPIAQEIVISILEKMLTYGSSKIVLLLNEFVKKVTLGSNRFEYIIKWWYELFNRGETLSFIGTSILIHILKYNHYIFPPCLLDMVDKLTRNNKLEILGEFIYEIGCTSDLVKKRIDYVYALYEILFPISLNEVEIDRDMNEENLISKRYKLELSDNRFEKYIRHDRERLDGKIIYVEGNPPDIEDLFKDNKYFNEESFTNWHIDILDMIYIIKNTSMISLDDSEDMRDVDDIDRLVMRDEASAIRRIFNNIDNVSSVLDRDLYIENIFCKIILNEMIDTQRDLARMSRADIIEMAECEWDILDIYYKTQLCYYLFMNFEDNMALDIIVDSGVRKTYVLIALFFIVLQDQLNEEKITNNPTSNYTNTNSNYVISLIDRLCG